MQLRSLARARKFLGRPYKLRGRGTRRRDLSRPTASSGFDAALPPSPGMRYLRREIGNSEAASRADGAPRAGSATRVALNGIPWVITDSTALFELTTHMFCCSWGVYFSAAACSEKDQGSMNLASNTAPLPSTRLSSAPRASGRPEAVPAAGYP